MVTPPGQKSVCIVKKIIIIITKPFLDLIRCCVFKQTLIYLPVSFAFVCSPGISPPGCFTSSKFNVWPNESVVSWMMISTAKRFALTVNLLWTRDIHRTASALRQWLAHVCVCVCVHVASCEDRRSHSPSHALYPGLTVCTVAAFAETLNGFSLIDRNEFGELRHGSECTRNGSLPHAPYPHYTR